MRINLLPLSCLITRQVCRVHVWPGLTTVLMEDAVARSSLAGLSLVTTALSKSSHRVRDSDLLSSGPPPSSPTAHTWITASSTPAPRRASLESSAERAATPTPRFDKSPSASSASDQIGGSSPFYTASWGSPYSQTFLDPQEQELFHRHRQRTPSTEPEADHPILQTDPAQWHPVPSKFVTGSGPRPSSSHQPLLCHKPEPAVSTTSRERANHTGRAFKDERVRLYLPRQTSSERSNWWSDDSSDAETDELAPRDVHKLSTWDDGVFWLDAGQGLDGISVAPTAKAPSQRRRRSTQRTSAEQGNLSTGHTSTGSDETIRQRDIWDPPTESKQDLTMGNDLLASKWATAPAEPARPIDEDVRQPNVKAPPRKDESPLVEKSLPLMPSPAPDGDNVEPGNSTTPKSAIAAKSMPLGLSRTPSSQITRKRLIWKGKACVIAPPSLDNRGDGVHYPRLLSSAEVSKRLKAWEEKGFDVRGFDHCHQYGGLESRGGESQSRPVYPSSETFREESAGGRYIVRIPDRQGMYKVVSAHINVWTSADFAIQNGTHTWTISRRRGFAHWVSAQGKKRVPRLCLRQAQQWVGKGLFKALGSSSPLLRRPPLQRATTVFSQRTHLRYHLLVAVSQMRHHRLPHLLWLQSRPHQGPIWR